MKKNADLLIFRSRINGKSRISRAEEQILSVFFRHARFHSPSILNSSPIYVIIKRIRNERGIAMKNKIQESYRIISLDGSDIYKLSDPSHTYGELTAVKDGHFDHSKFAGS